MRFRNPARYRFLPLARLALLRSPGSGGAQYRQKRKNVFAARYRESHSSRVAFIGACQHAPSGPMT
jgi:hypothetical protein